MRVVILGSGVVGVTSARYLSQAGHDVTVIDREPGPALETSAANAGKYLRVMRHHGRHQAYRLKQSNGCFSATLRWPFVLTEPSSS